MPFGSIAEMSVDEECAILDFKVRFYSLTLSIVLHSPMLRAGLMRERS